MLPHELVEPAHFQGRKCGASKRVHLVDRQIANQAGNLLRSDEAECALLEWLSHAGSPHPAEATFSTHDGHGSHGRQLHPVRKNRDPVIVFDGIEATDFTAPGIHFRKSERFSTFSTYQTFRAASFSANGTVKFVLIVISIKVKTSSFR